MLGQASPVAHLKKKIFRFVSRNFIEIFDIPEEHQDAGSEGMEVDVSVVLCVRIESNVAKDLHPDDGVNEEQHGNEQDDIRQSLKNDWFSKQSRDIDSTLL